MSGHGNYEHEPIANGLKELARYVRSSNDLRETRSAVADVLERLAARVREFEDVEGHIPKLFDPGHWMKYERWLLGGDNPVAPTAFKVRPDTYPAPLLGVRCYYTLTACTVCHL